MAGFFDQLPGQSDPALSASLFGQGTAPVGLLGGDPRDQMLLGLASGLLSNNGSRGLSEGLQRMTAAKMDVLKQQDTAQQIQLRNIALQQQLQEWNLQLPMLKAMAARMNGTQPTGPDTAQAPAQPDIPASPGGSLGSGTFGMSLGGPSATQPASQPAQSQSGGSSGASGSTMFPGVPDNVAFPTAAFGGFKAVLPLMSKYNEPTDLMKTLAAQGLQPGTPAWNQALAANVGKINSPTRLGNSGYYDPVKGFVPLPAPAAAGFINIPDQTDPSGFRAVQIGGGSTAVRTSSEAFSGGKAAGSAPYDGPVSIPTSDGRTLTLSKPEYAAYQQSGALPSRYSGSPVGAPPNAGAPAAAPPSAPSLSQAQFNATPLARAQAATAPDPSIMQAEMVKAQSRLAAAQLPDERQRAQDDITALQREMARLAPNAAGAPAPVVGMTPPLGTVPNADAAQKASADTMQQSYSRLQSTGTTATAALDALAKMKALAAQKNALLTAGFLGTNQSAVNPSAAEYEKQRANVIALMAQQLGASGTDAGRANISESVPDFGKPKEAIADGLGTLENQINAVQLKRNFLAPVYQAGDSKKYTTLENQFDQNISPSMVPLLTMQSGPQRAAALKAAAQNPAAKARLNWAAENGLLK